MALHDLSTYIGRRCRVVVHCPACGGLHTHEGTLAVSRRPGEVQLDGQQFTLGQIRAVSAVPGLETSGDSLLISGRAFNLLLQAGALLATLTALRAFAR